MITQERLKELLSYDQDTGVFIWRVSRRGHTKAGDVAGSLNNKTKYIDIKIDHKGYLAHRLAWLYTYGKFPSGDETDHINRIKTDNRIVNLREATYSLNTLNRDPQRNNTSGINGVVWHKKRRCWYAWFRGKYLGSSRSLAFAEVMRRAAEIAHSGMRPTD